MKSYEIRQLDPLPVVLINVYEGWRTDQDLRQAINQLAQTMDEATSPIYYISDITQARMDLDHVVQLATQLSGKRKVARHPKNQGVLMIAPRDVTTQAAEELGVDMGQQGAQVFTTLKEALDFVRRRHR